MIANDTQIRELIRRGVVEDARDHNIQPHSLDVRLSRHPLEAQEGCWNGYQPITNLDPIDPNAGSRTQPIAWRLDDKGKKYIIMPPGCAWIGSTHERVNVPPDMVMRVMGCSTIGRNFLQVHMTAGHIDAGFSGRITLELLNAGNRPLILRPLMRIGQLIFESAPTAERPYNGRYQFQHHPTAARDEI
jgi:dCTP deaminase